LTPDIPETQAYVARIVGLMGGAGELMTPSLEVRLVARAVAVRPARTSSFGPVRGPWGSAHW
jgi:hypothetical protein